MAIQPVAKPAAKNSEIIQPDTVNSALFLVYGILKKLTPPQLQKDYIQNVEWQPLLAQVGGRTDLEQVYNVFKKVFEFAYKFPGGKDVIKQIDLGGVASPQRAQIIMAWATAQERALQVISLFKEIAKQIPAAQQLLNSCYLMDKRYCATYMDLQMAILKWMRDPANQRSLSTLTHLDLSRLNLNYLPNEIALCTGLKQLNLKHNQFIRVPEEITGLKNLEELELGYNHLTQLPETIGNLGQLRKLYLQCNRLRELPNSFAKLRMLTCLYLGENLFKQLPKELQGLTTLEVLSIYDNELGQIPAWIGNFVNLWILSLEGNQIQEVPNEIEELQKLHELQLGRNQLKALPPGCAQLINLRVLELEGNRLVKLPLKFLENLKFLLRVDISSNPMLSLQAQFVIRRFCEKNKIEFVETVDEASGSEGRELQLYDND